MWITCYVWLYFRLSSIAGDKLRVNNPGIADLSDENRPNKLGEKFSELYDNEWTEAYESLEDVGVDEEEIIKKLLDILKVSPIERNINVTSGAWYINRSEMLCFSLSLQKEVYTCCQHYAKAQRHRLIQVISLPSRSDEQSQVQLTSS